MSAKFRADQIRAAVAEHQDAAMCWMAAGYPAQGSMEWQRYAESIRALDGAIDVMEKQLEEQEAIERAMVRRIDALRFDIAEVLNGEMTLENLCEVWKIGPPPKARVA